MADLPEVERILRDMHGTATWQDYEALRDRPGSNGQKIAFYSGWLWLDAGKEGPQHSRSSDLITILVCFWAFLNPEEPIDSLGRCLIEKSGSQACSPDLVFYKGKNIPNWQSDKANRINLDTDRLPDLVGEISDTTLSLDLDEQKQLYASLCIPEYWVIDVKAARVFAFSLNETGRYEPIETSLILPNLPISLIEQTLERLATETNTAAAKWFMQQLQA
ncbi:MAG: Uma2 family endonuclease [Alkalinema sp. RU_4_3]|nr:Uma2 family endonuclease [Alkalinema sp. RU_4_3]